MVSLRVHGDLAGDVRHDDGDDSRLPAAGNLHGGDTPFHLALALLFSVSIVLTFLTHLCIPFKPAVTIVSVYSIGLTYVLISVPFVFSGICVSLALTKFPATWPALRRGPGRGGDWLPAAHSAVGTHRWADGRDRGGTERMPRSTAFGARAGRLGSGRARRAPAGRLRGRQYVSGGAAAGAATGSVGQGRLEEPPLYEKWNSFSRIRIYDFDRPNSPPQVTSLSPKYKMPAQQTGPCTSLTSTRLPRPC